MEIIIMIGIPGSGKSTYYKNHFFHSHIRVNLDMLKTRNKENKLLEFCLKYGQPAVVDNTNVTKHERSKYIDLAREGGLQCIGYFFKSGLKECLARNEQRTDKYKIKPIGLVAKYKALEIPAYEEGFHRLYNVSIGTEGNFEIGESDKKQ